MNQRRAEWAEKSLKLFCKETGVSMEHDGYETVISDFLANLMHLADREKVSFAECSIRADGHYVEEVTHCDCEECPQPEDQERPISEGSVKGGLNPRPTTPPPPPPKGQGA